MKTITRSLVCRRVLPWAACALVAPALLGQEAIQDPPAALAEELAPSGQEASSQRAPRASLPPPGVMAQCKRLIDIGLYGGARARLQPIVDQHPKWARASLLLGLTYYREHRFEAANEHFAKALEANPEELAVRPFYGWSLYSLGELEAAQQMFESLLRPKPNYTAAHYALGLIDLDRDEVTAAREHFTATVRLASLQEDRAIEGRAHGRLGDLYLRLGELEAAKRELTRAIELFPEDHNALFTLSRVLQRLGDTLGAQAAREKFAALKAKLRPETARFPGG